VSGLAGQVIARVREPVSTGLQLLLPLLLLSTACASGANTVHGRAQVVTWNDVRVVALCDTNQRYELGVFVSTAAAQDADVRAWVEKDPTPVIVEINGLPQSSAQSHRATRKETPRRTGEVGGTSAPSDGARKR
jgi:hypothetical protein